jgi:MFS family permease
MRRIYYGWYIALALAITETISWGILYYSVQVFVVPMEAELGWTRAQIFFAANALFIAGLTAVFIGRWIDKHGARVLMTLGSLLASLLIMAWAYVEVLEIYYLIWFLLGIASAMVLYDPAFTVIANWFEKRRTVALAIVTFAAGLARTIFLPLSDFLMQTYGWREAVFILGLLMLLVNVPLHAFVLRRRPADLGLEPDGKVLETHPDAKPYILQGMSLKETLRGSAFWWLSLTYIIYLISSLAISSNFVAFLKDNGYDGSWAAALSGWIGVMQVFGRVVFAPLEARMSAKGVSVLSLSSLVIAYLALIVSQEFWAVIVFIVMFGFGHGAMTLTRPSIIANYYGTKEYGKINSSMSFLTSFSGTAGPIIAGAMYDSFGNYHYLLYLVLALGILAIFTMLPVNPPRKVQAPDAELVSG